MDFYNERIVKHTRKDHTCFGCCEVIPTGSETYYVACVWQGDFNGYYLCLPCMSHLEANSEEFSEGFCEGDVGNSRRQLEDDED